MMNFTKEQIGAILKQLRIDSGKTQKEVADILGRTQQIVGHWETGYSQPDANTLFSLCDIYGTTVDTAFGFNKDCVSVNELTMLKKYRTLDWHGKDVVDTLLKKEYDRCLKLLPVYGFREDPEDEPEYLMPIAAHERTDLDHEITDEDRQADLEILKQMKKGK